jgi:hypothetical protein
MKLTARLVHSEVSEVAISQAAFASMQIYIPWLAASKAPVADLAMLALAQSVVWPLAMIAQMQLRTIYVVQAQASLLPLFVQLRLAGCVMLVICAALAAMVMQSNGLLLALTVALALMKCAENVADILHGELQRAMEIGRAARSQTYRCVIFMVVYTTCLIASAGLVTSIVAALGAMVAWVAAVDMKPRSFWRGTLTHVSQVDQVASTLKAGLCLSVAVALTSLAMMVGRWAAMRAGDTDALAATALAGTIASAVAVVLGATLQFSITHARAHLHGGGMRAFRAWTHTIVRRLHLAFAVLALAWLGAAVLSYDFSLPLPGHQVGRGMLQTVIVLSGCFLVGGWLSVLRFRDTMLLYLLERHRAILLVAALQVAAAAAASLVLYPVLGWLAIGVAELLRGCCFVLGVRYANGRLDSAVPLSVPRVLEKQ